MHRRGISIIELQINGVVITVLVITGILLYQGCQARHVACVRNLVEAHAESNCPISGTPPAREGLALRCSDPKHHLRTDPVLGGAVAQTLPASDQGRTVATGFVSWGEIRSGDGRRVLEIHPKGWWRWAVAPVVQLLSLLYLGLAIGHLVAFVRRPRAERINAGGCSNLLTFVCTAGAAALCGWIFWCAFSSGWGRETITVGLDAVEYRTFAAGIDLGASRWPHPVAIVPAGPLWIVIFDDAGRRQVAVLRSISDEDLNAAAAMNESLHAPP